MGDEAKRTIKAALQRKAPDETGVYTILATTDDVDRDGDVVVPGGVNNLPKYLSENPVILFGHDYRRPPVGKAVAGRITEQAVELDIEFADTEFGREIKYLYDNGFMNSFSIGFIPRDHKVVGDQWYWTSWELLEVSAVPVPANSAANIVRSLEQKGVQMPELKKLFEEQRSASATRVEAPQQVKSAATGFWTAYIKHIKRR